ncbi:dynein heavy chain domain-containing protein 1-like isoform X2 [Babylonia areolata]|uniref:dynein heavy chain domain-containing protein 1-like isoform X2 n=1 Tax=Babylonia areolata TaxID=304850 RepID=UPI003FD37FF9
MASGVHASPQNGGPERLPLLHEGRSSLISPMSARHQTPTPRERASEWAVDIRKRIKAFVERHEDVNEDDILSLKQELIVILISTLQQDSRESWAYLCEILQVLEDYREYLDYFETRAEFHHYLERILHHVRLHQERLFDLQVEQHLNKVFPEVMDIIRKQGTSPQYDYCQATGDVNTNRPEPLPSTSASMAKKKSKPALLKLPDGTYPYSTHVLEDNHMVASQALTFGDLRQSMGNVAFEMAARESIWNSCLGTTALALSTNIPEEPKGPVKTEDIAVRKLTTKYIQRARPTPRKDHAVEIPLMTGREAVQYFASCNHNGKIKSLYFNQALSRHFTPYDLISVPKAKTNPEHYVFTSFGVLHVYPDQPAESLTLSQWQRQAVLWKAISSIPFFKNYLVKKAFQRWRSNKLYIDYQRKQALVEDSLLQNVPGFGAGLLQVSRLLKELITVQFLPFETDKTYQLGEYENNINYKNIQAEKILEKFFSYCKLVVDTTAEESFKKMKHCEEQVKKKTFFTKDSLHLQKVKKEERERNLQKAKRETGRLGNFVKLVDQMVVEHLFDITKTQVQAFTSDVLAIGADAPRDGFFKANLVFNKQDVLCLSPSKEKFQRTLNSTLRGIPAVLCSKSIPMDGSVSDPQDKDSVQQSQDPKTSSSQTHLDLKSMSASQISSRKHDSMTAITSERESQVWEGAAESSMADQEVSMATAPVSSRTAMDDNFPIPHLPHIATPTKLEDDLGIATPDLVLTSRKNEGLAVEGEGFLGQYNPLSHASLEDKLAMDTEYQACLKVQQTLMQIALDEVDAYCEFNHWLNEIHVYCRRWNDKSVKEFRGAAAFTIEQKLTELRQWSEKVRNFDRSFTSENGMFFVDCSAIHEGLLPRLNDIYQELITFVADEARSLASSFVDEMKVISQNMKDKRETVESFAQFAKNYQQYKKNTMQYQQRVEYIKSLYEVIRMSFRQLTPEEEKVEEGVWAAWEAFLMQTQDAGEFINTQTPLMTQELETTFQTLEREARLLAEQATSGCFLDPTQPPLQVLRAMKELREKFFRTQIQLREASQWRETIVGEPYNLKFLNEMTVKMDVRQELWKYVEASQHTIKDWKQMLFKKMNIKKALEKVIEWQSAAAQLKPHLPVGDEVLTTWYRNLQDFKKDLPVLYKLANDALKERHWQTIFLGMNEPYTESGQLTVAELMSYNLSDNADLVHSVYLSAVAEYDLEQQMSRIKRLWQDKNFKLAKHIPDSLFVKDPVKRASSPSRRTTKLERYRQERAAAAAGVARGLDVTSDDFYVLIDIEELKYQLEDSRISVEAMLQSPYVGDIRAEAEEWCSSLRAIEEITDLWTVCQKKWLYLLKVFEQPEMYRRLNQQAFKFESVHNKFKDWMRVVSNDSKVLSVVNRRRGEKGYRLLQGDNLRSLLLSLIQQQEEILKDLEHFLERHRSQFPRLYFLSNGDLVDMVGISRNPQGLVPFARKCFPGISTLTFTLPPGLGGLNSALDFALNGDKLQVVSMHGAHKEEVGLYARLEAEPEASMWLRGLESIMKNTMMLVLQACVQTRMEEGTCQPILILEELSKLAHQPPGAADLATEIHQKYRHWLLHFPAQCVLLAECILWERGMARGLEKQDADDLKMFRSNVDAKVGQYVDVLRESSGHGDLEQAVKERLHCLLSSLITQNIHHRDLMDNLLKEGVVTDSSFDWMRVLKFRMDIRNVLRAKTTVSETAKQPSPAVSTKSTPRRGRLKRQAEEEPAALTRTKTTVSTDYQFSPCYMQQLTNTFFYDYEYLGPFTSLVITPLMERTTLSLTQSLKNFQCCTLIGPAGTGKTDTIRHLSKMLGRCMFTVTCSDTTTLPMMQQYMMGMVQSGCWMLFDDTDHLTKGLMSVTAQQLDYLQTALRALDVSSKNQYLIRGQPRFDKKTGAGDKVIRRNSLTTLHPLPRKSSESRDSPVLERQRTVPHGFNEKGLVTYFEDTWVAERDQRRHSIEREIEIKESELYKNNRPPPLFYEHVKSSRRRNAPDYSKLVAEPMYQQRVLGNVMFSGKLITASANFGCFMTMGPSGATPVNIPDNFRLLMRPCALIKPDTRHILSVCLQTFAFQHHALWAQKLALFFSLLESQLPRGGMFRVPLQDVRRLVMLASTKLQDQEFLHRMPDSPNDSGLEWKHSKAEMDRQTGEEHCLVWALRQTLTPRVQEEDQGHFLSLMQDVFPQTCSAQLKAEREDGRGKEPLEAIVREVLKEDNLLDSQHLVEKVLQLNAGLAVHSPVVMVGPAGSGKSTCCHVLARAINLRNYKLFAPDHSNDELTTDRNVVFQSGQKLKILRGQEAESTASSSDPFLKDIDQDLKPKASVGLKKLRQLKQNISMAKNIQSQAEEHRKVLHPKEVADFPKVDVVRVVPTAMEPKQLLGEFKDGLWHGGLLGKIAQDSFFMWLANKTYMDNLHNSERRDKKQQADLPSQLLRWLILDGDLDPAWTEGMKTLYDGEQRLALTNGEGVQLRDTTSLIFETGCLSNASPSAVSRCTVVHCGDSNMQWGALYHTWKQTAKARWLLTAGSLRIVEELIHEVFPPTLKFLDAECCTAMLTDVGWHARHVNTTISGVMEVTSFLKIFSALLDKVVLREELEKKNRVDDVDVGPNSGRPGDGSLSRQMASRLTDSSQIESLIPHYIDILKGMFAFSYIWAFGGHLHDRFKDRFSKFAQDMLYRAVHSVRMPVWGQVFDYYVDESSGAFVRWSDRQQDKIKSIGGTFFLTPDVERYSYLLDLTVSNHHPVLLAGAPGVGKTALIQHLVLPKHTCSTMVMSPGLTAAMMHTSIIGHVHEIQSRAMGVMPGPGAGGAGSQGTQRHLFFIDDLSMGPSVGGYQPPVELLRDVLSSGGLYDHHRQVFQHTPEASFIAAATLPTAAGSGLGQASQLLSSRALRQFINVTVFSPNLEGLLTLFSRPLHSWLEEFPTYSVEHHTEFARALTLGLLELYQSVKERLRPTPVHAHYIFSLHDVARVVQGILLMSPRSRIRKMRTKKKEEAKRGLGRSTSQDSMPSRTAGSHTGKLEPGVAAPMMKVVAQLWCHECTRNFGDRLVSEEDHSWFSAVLEELAVKHFCMPRDDPKTEMAAISEEPPLNRGTPVMRAHRSPLPPDIPSDSDNEDMPDVPMLPITDDADHPPAAASSAITPMAGGSQATDRAPTSASVSETTAAMSEATAAVSETTENRQPSSGSPSQETSVTFSAATTGRTTDIGDMTEAGSEDGTGYETEAGETEFDPESGAETTMTMRGSPEADTPESDSSEDSSDESTSSEETGTLTMSELGELPSLKMPASQGRPTRSQQSLASGSLDSAKATPDILGTSVDAEGWEHKQDRNAQSQQSSLASAGQPQSGPNLKRQTRASGAKRGVTFKAGLIADKEQEAYFGPLMAIEEIKGPYKSVTEFLFSKYYLTCHTETQGLPTEKGYTESSEELLSEALHTCLNQYNEATSQRLDLVFFSEAVHHAARLSRVFAHPQGHALLLGMSYCTGRATLTRLAAYISHCKLFEPKPQADLSHNYRVVCEHMKRSCHHAGVVGKPTVLLVHEDLGDHFLPDVSALMARGTSPGMYSEDEMQSIVGHMMPGGVQTKRVDKIEQAFERFVKRVRQYLHIVVCLNYKGNSYSSDFHTLHDKIQRCPGLVKNAFSIDLYRPWGFSAFSRVAHMWLQDHRSPVKIPWNMAKRTEQIKMASDAMAYVHLSAKAAVERQYCHQKEPLRFYSPLTFLEFVHIFRVVAAYIGKIEQAKAVKYEQALGKINEAFGSISDFRREVSDLTPRHKSATDNVHSLVEFVEQQKQDYIQALDKCKVQEEKIAELQGPLDKLRKSAQSEFDKVNPVYIAAQMALKSLNKCDIEEIKSYNSPPAQVLLLLDALCLMMGKPQTFEDARTMMMSDQFLEQLIFYDKDHIPEDIFEDLKAFVNHPDFQVESMKKASFPASTLCGWVIAIHQYSTIYRKMQPHLKNLLEAESKFTRAQAELGQLRVEAHRIKSGLETTIGQHKEALKEAKAIEKQIQAIERKIARASNLMENMSMQHFLWRLELRKARRHLLTAPGDALITAACVCYHGPLDDKSRLELITDWLDRCRQGTFHFQAFMDRDPYSMIARLELLMESSAPGRGSEDGHSDTASRSGEDTAHSDVSSALHSTPQVRTFKYMPAIYDTSKFYKSELKKTDTMESIQPDADMDDSDDEEDMSSLPTRSNYTIQDILSDFDELSEWRMESLPTDLHSVQNALLMRVSSHNRRHCWPLLLDPDNQAEMWVKALQASRNIFTARDVADQLEDEGIPIDKMNQTTDSDRGEPPEPPPSRGTALTFSDVTEYTIAESEYTFASRTQTSGWLSRQTGDSDELRPVTSVTNSWDTLSLHADSTIERPDSNLWIVEADDPSLNSKLVSAIVHGVTVLVTHLERRPLGVVFRGLLLKQFYVDREGNKVVRVGDMQFALHPNFCLYLSSTVPLFLKGDGLYNLPIHRMCIINMAASDEAIINRLLYETMKVERKEFEGQRRSNESDIILHRQRLAQEHEAIREKTLNLDGPLLEDGTMLESLMACQSNVQRNRLILEETRFMGDHLQGKFAHYLPLMVEATVLYNTLRRMTVLHPMYYIPFYKFVDIFASIIKSRDRGKGSLGAPEARAQELSDAVTSAVFRHVSMMMFEQHYNLLALLVSLERMRISRKASVKELSLFVNGFEKRGIDEGAILEQKPAWMDKTAWIDCSIVESLHHPLHGLCHSLVTYSQEWSEYFQHPIALLTPVPGTTLQELSIFQKCLLWKFCCPDRMAELTKAIVTFELGSAVDAADHYNIREVYTSADQYTPTVFVLPAELQGPAWEATQGQPYVSPVHEVKRLAKEVGMEGKVRIINFGINSQGLEVQQALEDCIHNGNWLLLQNYHLSEEPSPPFFSMLKDLVYARWVEEDMHRESSEVCEEDHSLVTRSRPSTNVQHSRIHPSFRLWITTRSDGQRIIPGILIQHGLRVTVEATINFRSTLQKCYRSTAFLLNKYHPADQETVERLDRIMPLALLHAILLQQSYFGRFAFVHPHYWTLSDLSSAVEAFRLLVQSMPSHDATDLIAATYSHHCSDSTDARVVHAIVHDLALQAARPSGNKTECEGVAQLLKQLLEAGAERRTLKRTLDVIEDTSARAFSLPGKAQFELMACKSRIILSDMVQATGAPELLLQFQLTPSAVVMEAQMAIPQLLALLATCPCLQEADTQQIMPLDHFFHSELQAYRRLIEQIQEDLTLLHRGVRGEIALTSHLRAMLESLCCDKTPGGWLSETFTPCSSIFQWLNSLEDHVHYVQECCSSRPPTLWLPAFLRPDRLFPAVVQTHAKQAFKDVADIMLTFEVMPLGFVATERPADGVYVHGLLLANARWDSSRSVLIDLLPGDGPLHPMPPVWIRPLNANNETQRVARLSHYTCPLFSCPDLALQQDSNLITHVPLATVHPPTLWAQKRVALVIDQVSQN